MKLPRNYLTQLNGLHFSECTPSQKLSMHCQYTIQISMFIKYTQK